MYLLGFGTRLRKYLTKREGKKIYVGYEILEQKKISQKIIMITYKALRGNKPSEENFEKMKSTGKVASPLLGFYGERVPKIIKKEEKLKTMKKLKKLSLNMCIYMYLDYSKTNERGDAV